jgi:hypothetical protein
MPDYRVVDSDDDELMDEWCSDNAVPINTAACEQARVDLLKGDISVEDYFASIESERDSFLAQVSGIGGGHRPYGVIQKDHDLVSVVCVCGNITQP